MKPQPAAKHPPTPFVVESKNKYFGIFTIRIKTADKTVIKIEGSDSDLVSENAAFIVRACNSHDALLDAAKHALETVEDYIKNGAKMETAKVLRAAIALADGR